MLSEKPALIEEVTRIHGQFMRIVGPPSCEPWLELDLTISQLKSLFFLKFEGRTNFGTLAAALGVTPPNVTGIIERLVEHGLVSRMENPKNRRMLLIQLTGKGKELVARLMESGSGRIMLILNKMNMDELKALVKGLSAVVRIDAELQDERTTKK